MLFVVVVVDFDSWVYTSAGNLFKFYCRSSTEYQEAVLD